ncbi:type VII secretion protein EccB [Streptacidiphilus sp. 4-A2]|nr:type VII secretion protein EccB [Streptacidiphilus sp. 4-A2]
MQTQRDHQQAYQFAMGRLATALVSGDPGRGESPTRRAALGTFLGTGIVVLLCAGFGVYGLISPAPTTSWRTPGSIVVDQRTGASYLYLNGELRPVRNYASALLLAGKDATVRSVSEASLGDTPHGPPVGIPDAPDELPTPTTLVSGSWTSCLRPDLPSAETVDFAPGGRTAGFPADRQALLTTPDGLRHLLWRGVDYPVPSTATLIALGLDGDQPVAAPQNWLRALPTGTPLAAAPVPDAGRPGGSVAGAPVRIGQLFTADGGRSSYVMTAAGIAPVDATEAALLAAQPGAAPARQVSQAALAAAPVADSGAAPGGDLPDVLDAPQLNAGGQAVCLLQHTTDGGQSLASTLVLEHGAAATGDTPVLVPPNGGVYAVNQEDVMAQVSDPRQYLITDQGTAYPVDSSSATLLGLSGASPVVLPQSLLAALPSGPTLSRSAAQATTGGTP